MVRDTCYRMEGLSLTYGWVLGLVMFSFTLFYHTWMIRLEMKGRIKVFDFVVCGGKTRGHLPVVERLQKRKKPESDSVTRTLLLWTVPRQWPILGIWVTIYLYVDIQRLVFWKLTWHGGSSKQPRTNFHLRAHLWFNLFLHEPFENIDLTWCIKRNIKQAGKTYRYIWHEGTCYTRTARSNGIVRSGCVDLIFGISRHSS